MISLRINDKREIKNNYQRRVCNQSGISRAEGSSQHTAAKKTHEILGKIQSSMPSDSPQEIPSPENFATERVFHSLVQIQVLDQNKDGTSSGFENCGFHALKNALFILSSSSFTKKELEKALLSQEVFVNFYHKYCEPLLSGKVGRNDATAPVLQNVIQKILEDPDPAYPFDRLQQKLKENTQSLAFLQIATLDENFLGKPFFLPTDEEGMQGTEKLARLLVQRKEGNIIALIGNQSQGHWFTLCIAKNSDGELHFMTADSQDNHHKDTHEYSASVKTMQLIKETDPYQLIKESFTVIGDELQRKSEWINDDEMQKFLLDASGKELGISPMERMLHLLTYSVFSVIEPWDWYHSKDLEPHLYISNIQKLLAFYIKNLDASHPKMAELKKAYSLLERKGNKDFITDLFREAHLSLENVKKSVSLFQYRTCYWTFKEMKTIYDNMDELTQDDSETERMNKANQKLEIGGVETGFLAKSGEQGKGVIREKTYTLLLAMQKAREKNRVRQLVQKISGGDNCLTGRISRAQEFHNELCGFSFEEALDMEKVQFLPKIAIGRAIEMMMEKEEVEDGLEEEFIDAIKADSLDAARHQCLAEAFAIYGKCEMAVHFITFLESKGFSISEKNPDWHQIMSKIVAMPEFAHYLELGKKQAKSDLI